MGIRTPRSNSVLVVLAVLVLAPSLPADQPIPIHDLLRAEKATVRTSDHDWGVVDFLFDGNWDNSMRMQSVPPVFVQIAFDAPRTVSKARIRFIHAPAFAWSLCAADTGGDLSNRAGTFVEVFGRTDAEGKSVVTRDFSDAPVTRRLFSFTAWRLGGTDNNMHICEIELWRPCAGEDVEVGGKPFHVDRLAVTPAARWPSPPSPRSTTERTATTSRPSPRGRPPTRRSPRWRPAASWIRSLPELRSSRRTSASSTRRHASRSTPPGRSTSMSASSSGNLASRGS